MSTKALSHPYLIYGWWIMSFEFVGALYALYVTLKAPKKAVGAVGLLAVLTASTFVACHEMYTGDVTTAFIVDKTPVGIQYLIFKLNDSMDGLTNKYVGSLSNYGQMGRAEICYFAGLVTCAVANAVLTLTIADDDVAAPAAVESA